MTGELAKANQVSVVVLVWCLSSTVWHPGSLNDNLNLRSPGTCCLVTLFNKVMCLQSQSDIYVWSNDVCFAPVWPHTVDRTCKRLIRIETNVIILKIMLIGKEHTKHTHRHVHVYLEIHFWLWRRWEFSRVWIIHFAACIITNEVVTPQVTTCQQQKET